MKIEKINENQIRCYLSKEEMESRQIRLRELAYGTEKARALFHDMLQEAFSRFGFRADNIPVMVEAIPLYDESLVLIVTKVENPEELDTRFSSFAPFVKSRAADTEAVASSSPLGQLLDAIRREITDGGRTVEDGKASGDGKVPAGGVRQPAKTGAVFGAKAPEGRATPRPAEPQLYTFRSLGLLADAARIAAPDFDGTAALYRDPSDGKYYLFLSASADTDPAGFRRVLAALSEFGSSEYITPAREQHLREHCEVLCAVDALRRLAELSKDTNSY